MKKISNSPKDLAIITIVVSLFSITFFFVSRFLITDYLIEEGQLFIIFGLIIASIGYGIVGNLIYFSEIALNKKHNIKRLNMMYFVFLVIQMLWSLIWFNRTTIFIMIIYILLIYFLWILFFNTNKKFLINPTKLFYNILIIYLIALIFTVYLNYNESLYKEFGIKHIVANLSYILVYLHIIPSTKYFSLYAEYKKKRGENNE